MPAGILAIIHSVAMSNHVFSSHELGKEETDITRAMEYQEFCLKLTRTAGTLIYQRVLQQHIKLINQHVLNHFSQDLTSTPGGKGVVVV